jgi:hypothetical protein
MKNTMRSFLMIALFAVIGFTMATCDTGGEPYVPDVLNGTVWMAEDIGPATTLNFNSPKFLLIYWDFEGGIQTVDGTYTISDSKVTLKSNNINLEGTLVGDESLWFVQFLGITVFTKQ